MKKSVGHIVWSVALVLLTFGALLSFGLAFSQPFLIIIAGIIVLGILIGVALSAKSPSGNKMQNKRPMRGIPEMIVDKKQEEPVKETEKKESGKELCIVGKKVFHKTFGQGVVQELEGHYMTVKFFDGERKLIYPDAFERRYLSFQGSGQPLKYAEKSDMPTKIKEEEIMETKENKPQKLQTDAEKEADCFGEILLKVLEEEGNPFSVVRLHHSWHVNRIRPSIEKCLTIDFLLSKKYLRIALYLRDSGDRYNILKNNKQKIEEMLGFKTIWRNGSKNKNTLWIERIIPLRAYDHEDYERAIVEAFPYILKFVRVSEICVPDIFEK